jgi:hypothetical protein
MENPAMSSRERWIVYPLLFMTLGIALRDKIIPAHRLQLDEIAAGQIHCNQLLVDQEIGAKQVSCIQLQAEQAGCKRLQVAAGIVVRSILCGEFAIAGPKGRPTVVIATDPKTNGGIIETISSAGAPLVRLEPTNAGGVVHADAVLPWERKKNAPPSEQPKTPSGDSLKELQKGPDQH